MLDVIDNASAHAIGIDDDRVGLFLIDEHDNARGEFNQIDATVFAKNAGLPALAHDDGGAIIAVTGRIAADDLGQVVETPGRGTDGS